MTWLFFRSALAVFCLPLCLAPARAQVILNEFMASNSKTLADQDGDYSDWIELYNAGATSVNLEGWHLTDSATQLAKWAFPNVTLAPYEYVIVFASGKDRAVAGSELHANFSLDSEGEYLALVQPDGQTVVSEYAPAYPRQLPDISYGTDQGSNYYFTQPSPRAANSSGYIALVADTKFSRDRGFYDAPFDLTITTATANAVIRYTTNGVPPTATTGSVYASPIQISGTTVLRAAAFKPGYLPSKVDTQTYLFLDDILHQSADGKAPPGWPSSWGGNTVNYGMDPDIVNDPRYRDTIKDDLKAIPSFSIVMDLNDLFDRSRGIYANPGQDGINRERPSSLELIYPDGAKGFQVNAGIRIRGGFSRSTDNPKHAFRFFFRQEYGDAKLRYPLFGDEGADVFDAIDLRTFQNYSWSFQGDGRGVFIRDQFSRDAQLATGHQAERGRFYHLYINGQYWGLYNTCERPEASYGATYFGGNKDDYDVVKADADRGYVLGVTDGNVKAWTRLWNAAKAGLSSDEAYQKIQGNNADGTPNPDYEVLLDVDNLIDYMLVIFYGGNLDAPISNFLSNTAPNNFFGVRNRNSRQGFRFFVHDAEHTLLDVNQNRTGPYPAGNTFDKSNPQWIFQQCWANAEFRIRVADHVQRHLFNGGGLSSEGARNLFLQRKAEIDRAVVGESARWGDSKRSRPFTRDVEWIAEINRIANSYMAQRTGVVLKQLRAKNLYPNLDAPSFSQHGGNVPKGFELAISAPAGQVYYTLDGTDPRLPGGAVAPGALVYGGLIRINESATLKSRALEGSTWSALNEAGFTVIQAFTDLLITEIMYNPPHQEGTDDDEFEFIELKNVGPVELDLSGVSFTNGVRYTFPNGARVGPNQFVVLAGNAEAFATRYPNVRLDGVYSGRLSNAGEALTLVHAVGTPIFAVNFSDQNPWPISADGQGFSLAPVNPNLNPDPNDPANWRASSIVGGTPGADDLAPNIQPVWINEILTHTDPPQLDEIELYNPGPDSADIGHWFLTDQRSAPKKFRIPPGTVIPVGGFVVFTEADFNPAPGLEPSFRLDSHGEEIYLYSADAAGNLTGYSDGFGFGAAANGVSFGRYVTSTGEIQYPAQLALTPGAANAGPLISPVVINEVHYQPAEGGEEFVELKNTSTAAVKLYDAERPENTWKLEGIGFDFPPNSELGPNGLALIVGVDPETFRARHGVPASVPVFGPFQGALQNSGELVQLTRPDTPDVETNGVVVVPFVVVDEVQFNDKAPWPIQAAGSGASLERINPLAYGNDPANWRASFGAPSPGIENDGNRAPRVAAGADRSFQSSNFPFTSDLSGTAADDGRPEPPGALSVAWSQTSGPGPVTFGNPGQLATTVQFPGVGTYVLRLTAGDGALESSDELSVTIERMPADVTFVPAASIWKYLDDGSDQGWVWRRPEFDDSTWPSGAAELGYGDGGEKTVISNRGTVKYYTYYFRHAFEVNNAAAARQLRLRLQRDDGGIVYLNGIEVFRSNMPGGEVGSNTPASSVVGGGDESAFFEETIDPALLREGRNVLAVEIHQANLSSSDISFDLELSGLVLPDNQAPLVNAGGDFALSLPALASLSGAALDDGLPIPPGQLTVLWSKLTGPGEVAFDTAASAVTTATFSAPGTYVLRLSAADGALSAQDDVTVTVNSGEFADWQARQFTVAELSDPAISGEEADPDHDGHTNFQEYICGTGPKDPSSVLKADTVEWIGPPLNAVEIRFQAMSDRAYTVQSSDSVSGPWREVEQVAAQADPHVAVVTDATATAARARFYRIVTATGWSRQTVAGAESRSGPRSGAKAAPAAW